VELQDSFIGCNFMERTHNSENMFVGLVFSASEFMNQFRLLLVPGCVHRKL